MSDSTTEQSNSGADKSTLPEDVLYVDDDAGDSEFEPNEGSAGQDDDSIAPDEDIPDDGEIDSLMKESEMSLSDLLAAYGVPSSEIPTDSTPAAASTSTVERRVTRKRRQNGSAVTAELVTAPTSETPASTNNNNSANPSGDAIEIDLTKESNEDDGSNTSHEQQPGESGALVIDEGDAEVAAAADDEAEMGDESEEQGDTDDEDEVLDEAMAADDDEEEMEKGDVTSWCRAFASGESPEYNSEEDEDYQPNVEGAGDWQGDDPDIRVGEEWQAVISPAPLPPSKRTDSHLGEEAALVWQPGHLSEADTEVYERNYANVISEPHPNYGTPDDEEALFLLMRSHYDTDEALTRLRNKPVQPNEIRRPYQNWSEEECTNFEKGFATFDKDFFKICRTRLPHKTTKDLVEFYYFYKKTARYEELMRLLKKEKNKPSHPAIVDFMDILMQQQYAAAAASAQEAPSTSTIPNHEGEHRVQPQSASSPGGDGASSGSSQSVIAISSNDSGDEAQSHPRASSGSPSSSAPPSSMAL